MEQAEGITVMVGIFSGRPNPEMTFDDDAAEEVANLLKEAIGSQPTHAQPRPKLGQYYGFFVTLAPRLAERYGLPAQASVFEGVIAESDSKADSGWRDVAGLERFLIEQAVRHDYRDLLERVGVDTSEFGGTGSAS